MNYYMGIDGGGTKSKVRIMDESFENIDSAIGGASNISTLGKEDVKKNLSNVIDKLLERHNLSIDSCISICIGSAGVDRDRERTEMEEVFDELGFKKVIVVNDTKIVLAADGGSKEGIVVISGTGSIIFGISDKGEQRAGGWGYLLGDEGSGYWIGYEAIKSVLSEHDSVIEKTSLSKKIMDKFDIDNPVEFINRFYIKNNITKLDIASLARIVDEEAILGNNNAKDILSRGAEELAKRVAPIYENLFKGKKEISVVLNGSVINNSKYFQEKFIENVSKVGVGFNFKPISKDPSYGACYLNKVGE